MKKLNFAKSISLIVAGCFIVLSSLVLFIKSYSIYQDEYGTDISFNSDYVVSLLCGVVVTIYACAQLKGMQNQERTYYLCSMVVSTLIGFYPLGVFFKAMNKHKLFADYQNYLLIGVLGVLLLIYSSVSYLKVITKQK